MQAFLLQLAAESLKSPFKNPLFGNAVPQSLVQNSSVMHVEKDVDGDRATFIFWAPDFEPSTSANGNTALEQDTWISAKTRNFRKLIKLIEGSRTSDNRLYDRL